MGTIGKLGLQMLQLPVQLMLVAAIALSGISALILLGLSHPLEAAIYAAYSAACFLVARKFRDQPRSKLLWAQALGLCAILVLLFATNGGPFSDSFTT